jgi:hypothetical protein
VERALSRFTSDREQVTASIADLEATLAEADSAPAPTDRLLDFWNALSDGIRGGIDTAQSVAEVNERLRDVLDAVRIDTLDDGRIRLLATFADRDEWWDGDDSLSADAPPLYPNTVVADSPPTLPTETEPNAQL